MKSKFLSLERKDAIKALALSVLTSVLAFIQISLEAGQLEFDFKKIGTIALAATGAYILKNWLTNSNDELFKKEKK